MRTAVPVSVPLYNSTCKVKRENADTSSLTGREVGRKTVVLYTYFSLDKRIICCLEFGFIFD